MSRRLPPPIDLQGKLATQVQALVRGHQARKKYKINPMVTPVKPDSVYCVGNDPDVFIPSSLKSDQPFALVATSCLRALDIAQLFCADHTAFVPKIFIVDINPRVKDFWLVMKTIFNCSTSANELMLNIARNESQLSMVVSSSEPYFVRSYEMALLIAKVCDSFGFERVKKMVLNLVALTHDWTDKHVFEKIKAICSSVGLGVTYVYASNIISCIDGGFGFDQTPKIAQMLRNIKTLQPKATVHSNLDVIEQCPSKMICYAGTGDINQLVRDIGMREERKRVVSIFSQRFSLLFSMKQYPEALQLAKSLYEGYQFPSPLTQQEKSDLSALAHNLGASYQEMGDSRKALEYLAEAHALRSELSHPKLFATNQRRLRALDDVSMSLGLS